MGTNPNKEITQKSNDDQILSTNQYDTVMNTEIISKLDSSKDQSSISNTITTEKTTENTNVNNSYETIPYVFKWKGDAKKVYIKGDFLDNWKTMGEMTKNKKTGEFEYLIYLSKTIHQFKFIVDGNWVYSEDYDIFRDNSNNVNNILDMTNANATSDLTNIKTTKDDMNQTQKLTLSSSTKKKVLFNNIFPSKNELNIVAPNLPCHYRETFDLDNQSNQIKIGEKNDGLKFQIKNIDNENNTYKTILVCPHEKLLHLCSNNDENDYNETQYIKTSASCRIQHKFLTIVYYRPKKRENRTLVN